MRVDDPEQVRQACMAALPFWEDVSVRCCTGLDSESERAFTQAQYLGSTPRSTAIRTPSVAASPATVPSLQQPVGRSPATGRPGTPVPSGAMLHNQQRRGRRAGPSHSATLFAPRLADAGAAHCRPSPDASPRLLCRVALAPLRPVCRPDAPAELRPSSDDASCPVDAHVGAPSARGSQQHGSGGGAVGAQTSPLADAPHADDRALQAQAAATTSCACLEPVLSPRRTASRHVTPFAAEAYNSLEMWSLLLGTLSGPPRTGSVVEPGLAEGAPRFSHVLRELASGRTQTSSSSVLCF